MEEFLSLSYLEDFRKSNDLSEFLKLFRKLIYTNKKKTIEIINDEEVNFGFLFSVQSEIFNLDLLQSLNYRNTLALKIIREIKRNEKKILNSIQLISDKNDAIHSSLKWMLVTGHRDDGMSNEYDELLDHISIILAKIYRDKSILPILVDMIFTRYNKDRFVHDLIWAFFECNDPKSLFLVVDKLKSRDLKDIELANKLLRFIPSINESHHNERNNTYIDSVNWLNQNSLFLHYTGENFQETKSPSSYVVDLEAKYICRKLSDNNMRHPNGANSKENKILKEFRKLDIKNRKLLSDFSFLLYKQDESLWKLWLKAPITKQIMIASSRIAIW